MAMAFRMGQGLKTKTNASIPAHGIFLSFQAAQPQIAQREGMSAGFTNPVSAHSTPAGMKLKRGRSDADAAAKRAASNMAERVVSQMGMGATSMGGARAQTKPARFA